MTRPLAALLLAAPLALQAGTPTDPLALVPPGSTTVGMVRVSDLRSSPWAAHLFSEADGMTIDGDGARFLAEAHLRPTEDVDTIVFAATSGADGVPSSGIAIFEGRFDAESVAQALVARGATRSGRVILFPEKGEHADAHHGKPAAIAFVGRHLAVAGPQADVEAALAYADASSRADFRSGAGLGRHLRRVPSDATAWALVDLSKNPLRDRKVNVTTDGNGAAGQLVQLAGVMRQVPFLAMSATLKKDAMRIAAFAQCDDDETRGLLEDSVRGLLAAWRLAVQDSKPDLVPILRSFKVEEGKDGVSLAGTIPGSAVAQLLEKKKEQKEQKEHGHTHAH